MEFEPSITRQVGQNNYDSYPSVFEGVVKTARTNSERYVFDVIVSLAREAELLSCLCFSTRTPKENDIVICTFMNNRTTPVIIGVEQKPEEFKADQEYLVEHPSGTKILIKANGDINIEDKHKNKITTTKDGVTTEDLNGNKREETKAGLKFTDANGNTLEMAKDGVKVNGHFLVTNEFLDAMLVTDAANLGIGNLVAPVPVFPATLAKWLPQITATPDKFLTNKEPRAVT